MCPTSQGVLNNYHIVILVNFNKIALWLILPASSSKSNIFIIGTAMTTTDSQKHTPYICNRYIEE